MTARLKPARLGLSIPDLRPEWFVGLMTLAFSAVIWLATTAPYRHPVHPEPPSLFTACIYFGLAALAFRRATMPQPVRVLVWAPVVTHLVLIGFASCCVLLRGYWPSHSVPDPKQLELPIAYGVTILAVVGTILLLPAGAGAWFVAAFDVPRKAWREKAVDFAHSAAVWAFAAWLWLYEVRDQRLLTWLAD